MNHQLYRLIFNKKRGQLMAVAETATSEGKSTGTTGGSSGQSAARWATLRSIGLAVMFAYGLAALCLPGSSDAQVVAYRQAPASQQATIIAASNGVPVVNIQTPNSSGLSHNLFDQFDVTANGLILNNSRTNASTQLAGWIQGNPWLATGTARVILNEVVASTASVLNGYVEVAGSQAQVIIANPAGITCSGCGFLNANRVTLTTGSPIVTNGNLNGYRVQGGTIRIDGDGMDASRIGYTDLISRAVEVNSGLWAQNLTVTTGANVVDAANTTATPTAPAGGTAPSFAVDVAQLGGMYAGKITLVGTESGVGVRNAGEISATAGNVVVTADGQLTNSGMIHANTDVTISAASGVDNTGKVYGQGNTRIETLGDIANTGGLIAAGNDLSLAASGTTSRITGDAASTFGAGLATDGSFSRTGKLDASATESISILGKATATSDLSLSAHSLDLAGSETSGGNVNVTATAGNIDASSASILATGTLTANAALAFKHDDAVTNAGTLSITAQDFSNVGGGVYQVGTGSATFSLMGVLNNTGGTLWADQALLVRDPHPANRTLAISNGNGVIYGGTNLTVSAASLSGKGKLLAENDLSLNLTSNTTHTGEIVANRNVDVSVAGALTNNGAIKAGGTLAVEAAALTNGAAGELSGTSTRIAVTDGHTLTNRGLIDGSDTFIKAGVLNNLGTGRIYGDHVAIAATTLTIASEGANSPVIAARDRLDIGAATVDNQENALIFSAGDMAIGGALDANHRASGHATTVTNTSATIEALGNLSLATDTLVNQRARLTIGTEASTALPTGMDLLQYNPALEFFWGIDETNPVNWRNFVRDRYIGSISTLLNGTLDSSYRTQLESLVNAQPRSVYEDSINIWNLLINKINVDHPEYIPVMVASLSHQTFPISTYNQLCRDDDCDYVTYIVSTRTDTRDVITATSPNAVIRAGGDATIDAASLTNRYGAIEAAGDLSLTGSTLSNVGAELFLHSDTVNSSHRLHWVDRDHGTTISYGSTQSLIGSVPGVITAGGLLSGSYTDRIDNVTIRQGLAPLSTSSGTTVSTLVTAQVTTSGGVMTVSPTTSLPGSGLYHPTTDASAHYAIETDPRFANYRNWLSSDYMLQQLGLNMTVDNKRLGDGFYEQRLLTEEIAQLTGRRLLTGYADDESQFKALMDAGLSVVKKLNLGVGIALTAEQMAQLTSDIVWLVKKEVTLPNGDKQTVLVPQVYLRVKEGDVLHSGALIAGDNVQLDTKELMTSGTIAGRKVVDVSGTNINNVRGMIRGNEVLARAKNDLSLDGGTIQAEEMLIATAGHDLTAKGATTDLSYRQPGTSNRVDKAVVDRVAGLYVTGNTTTGAGGTLLASAGNDLTLNAAAIVNTAPKVDTSASGSETDKAAVSAGMTTLIAGHDLTFDTVTETNHAATRSKKVRWQENSATDVGSTVQTTGDLTIQAGNDLSAIAATVIAGGALVASAGNDLTITTGEASYDSDYHRKSSSSGFLSKSSSETHITTDRTTAVSSSFSGETVDLQAGRDVHVTGSNVEATDALKVIAGRDLTVDTAQNTDNETFFRSQKKSGFSASLMGGISYGKSARKQNQAVQTVTQVSSTLSGADVTLSSGRDTTITASNVLADRDLTVRAGRDVNILAAADTEDTQSQYKSSSTSIGLMGGLSARFTMFGKADGSQNGESSVNSARTSLLSANKGDLTVLAGIDQQYKGTGHGNVTTQGADLLASDAITLSGNAVDLQAVANVSSSHSVSKSKSITVGAAPAGTVGSLITAISDKVEQAQNSDNDRLKGALALKAGYDAYKLIDGGAAKAIAEQGTIAHGDPGQSAFGVSVSIGVSKSKSESRTNDIQVSGTNLQAKRIDIEATETDLAMAAAKLQAEDIALTAKRDILLEAAANQSEIHSSNKSSNYGAGVTIGIGQQNGISFQLSASQAKGKANGSETTWDNTLITASNSLTVKSGRDTTLRGAQLTGDHVKLDIGRDLLIESLQDNSAYYSKQTSSGFSLSLCIPPICVGASSGSISASSQKIKHNYQSAVGQSGIAAGEGGFDITVGNRTELVGAAITGSSDPSKNHLTTASLTSRDLINTQSTKASGSSMSLSASSGASALSSLANNATSNLLANLGSNAALPKNGSETSTTRSVISPATINITGTGDKATDDQSHKTADELTSRDPKTANASLTNTLTLQQAQVLEEKIKKQKENQEAANLVGGVLSNMVGDLAVSRRTTLQNEENARAEAAGEPAKIITDWADGSPEKIALHGIVGLIEAKIGGGNAAAGVLGAISQEVMAPILSEYLEEQGFAAGTDDYKALMQLGATLTGTAIGALADGTKGAATAASSAYQGVTNNYLKHEQVIALGKELLACKTKPACQEVIDKYKAASDKNNNDLVQAARNGDLETLRAATQDMNQSFNEHLGDEMYAVLQRLKGLSLAESFSDLYLNSFALNANGVLGYRATTADEFAVGAQREVLINLYNRGRISGVELSEALYQWGTKSSGLNEPVTVPLQNLLGLVFARTAIASEESSTVGGSTRNSVTNSATGEANPSGAQVKNIVGESQVKDFLGQERKFWSQEPVQFSGNKVYQRSDLIDPSYVDPKTNMTNLELMQSGRAPIGPDGKAINLHHMLQSQNGPIAEVTQSFHQSNSATIHINAGSDIPSGIDRRAFDRWRSEYWINRARDFLR